jgi:hypothetical protein
VDSDARREPVAHIDPVSAAILAIVEATGTRRSAIETDRGPRWTSTYPSVS